MCADVNGNHPCRVAGCEPQMERRIRMQRCSRNFQAAWILAGFALLCGSQPVCADLETDGSTPVAQVNGRPISQSEVAFERQRLFGLELAQEDLELADRVAIERLIDRVLVDSYLQRQGLAPNEEEVELELERLENQLQQRANTLDDHLQALGLSRPELERRTAFHIGWRRYRERFLTDANIERYFERNRRHFDGTRLRVAHILLQADGSTSPEALIQQAQQIRRQMVDGQLDFAEAARRYSHAPSAEEGGSIGYIERDVPMSEPFSKAAFELEEGEISQPVVSPHGVHLIRWTEQQPGTRQWQEVRESLEPAVESFLFRWAAEQERANAHIERFPEQFSRVP